MSYQLIVDDILVDFPTATKDIVQDQLKAAHMEQEKKKKRESANREANKLKLLEHENKVRGALLDAFSKEDQERLQKNAQKRLGKEN